VRLWDIEKGQDEAAITLTGFEDSIQSIAWNPAGTLLAATCRDRKIRIFDPRAGTQPIRQGDGHAGIKGSRVVWVGEDRLASTGVSFSLQGCRKLQLTIYSSADSRSASSISGTRTSRSSRATTLTRARA
jgi:coronin-1B/1C/6